MDPRNVALLAVFYLIRIKIMYGIKFKYNYYSDDEELKPSLEQNNFDGRWKRERERERERERGRKMSFGSRHSTDASYKSG
jgi:hypothetical protein